MRELDMSTLQWSKSSHSDSGEGECVEVARTSAHVAVRDSKNPRGPVLTFDPSAWQALIMEIKAG